MKRFKYVQFVTINDQRLGLERDRFNALHSKTYLADVDDCASIGLVALFPYVNRERGIAADPDAFPTRSREGPVE